MEEYVANALSPSKVIEVKFMKMKKWRVSLFLIISFLWQLVSKGKMHVLAAKLTGWKIDIKSETQAEQEYGRAENLFRRNASRFREYRLSFCSEQGVIGMKQRKIPLRKCVACQEMMPKRDLIRVVKTPEDEILIDLKGKKVWARCLLVR